MRFWARSALHLEVPERAPLEIADPWGRVGRSTVRVAAHREVARTACIGAAVAQVVAVVGTVEAEVEVPARH